MPPRAMSGSPTSGRSPAGEPKCEKEENGQAQAQTQAQSDAAGDLRIAGRYRLVAKLGAGSFGDIYEGEDTTTGKPVAIKLERVKAKNPLLSYEARLYRMLNQGKMVAPGIPAIHYSGVEGDFRVMVIDLLGPSLEDLFCFCGRALSWRTTMMLADQLLHRLEFLHQKCLLHRDLKPENFVMGVGRQSHHVYMIDFGLAKRYKDVKTNTHIPYNTGKPMVGTARYASVNTHIGCEQSRRDDLEGLSIILVYFVNGGLPWQGMKAPTRAEKDRMVTEKKIDCKPEQLCRGLPNCFREFNKYARGLKFEDDPDYERMRALFRADFAELDPGCREYDWNFDWVKRYQERKAAGLIDMSPIGMSSQQQSPPSASGGSKCVQPGSL
eukprot:TRINITY_DN23969_c0_g2_i1.p1 TRINITY_DN23969_c0_g2~~TRINITY_DN23969_c0_g2_i1.p1  ORF type:complete len:381 (+),score=81.53 TRINITY_DN23969_c0_g2_i1:80-1222(+)